MFACRFSGRSIAPTGWAHGLPTAGLQAKTGRGQRIVSLMVVVGGVILVVFGGTLAEVLSVIGSAIDGAS
jgi:hypothetical protein